MRIGQQCAPDGHEIELVPFEPGFELAQVAEPLEQLTRMTLAGQAPVAAPPADNFPAGPVN